MFNYKHKHSISVSHIFLEFDPEPSPKWKCLCDLLQTEIPEEVKSKQPKKQEVTKILVLCHDSKTCYQLNQYLTMGANKYLFYTALRRDLPINSVASKFKRFQETVNTETTKKDKSDIQEEQSIINQSMADDEEFNFDDMNKSNFVLTLTQIDSKSESKAVSVEDVMFEPISQVNLNQILKISLFIFNDKSKMTDSH